MRTRFTLKDFERVGLEREAKRCSVGALAAICGLTVVEALACLDGRGDIFDPEVMLRSVERAGGCGQRTGYPDDSSCRRWSRHGLSLVQLEGAAARWVGVCTRGDVRSIWDVAAMSAAGGDGWVLVGDWRRSVIPRVLAWSPGATGHYEVTGVIEVVARDQEWLDSAVSCYLHDYPSARMSDVLAHVRSLRPAWIGMSEDVERACECVGRCPL